MGTRNEFNSEATVQAEVYHKCRLAGLNVGMERRFSINLDGKPRTLRVDLALFVGGRVVAVVEVKKTARSDRTHYGRITRQQLKYEALGIPFRYCRGPEQVAGTVAWLKRAAAG